MIDPGAAKQHQPRASVRQTALSGPAGLLACGFGSGLSPVAPGTAGTLVAVPLAYAFGGFASPIPWAILAGLFLLGVYVCGETSRRLGTHDHPAIVWDEMVGYWLSVSCVPLSWPWLLAAFVLFRLFDIFKPWPIRLLDRRVSGGFGIMFDDCVAALYTLVLLAGAQWIGL